MFDEPPAFDSPLSGALAMAERGWSVFPVDPPARDKPKKPAIRGWQKAATTDEQQIRDWAEQFPGCNFGIATESSGLVVLDEDTPGALDKWAESESIGRPETFAVASGREGGGTHHWYRSETEYKSSSPMKRAGYDVDVKARGGFVVCPGSIHASGEVYRIVNDVDPVPLPEAIAVHLRLPNERMYEAEPPSELLPDLYDEGYLDATKQYLKRDLDEAAAAPLGADPRWEPTVMHVAYRLVEMSNCAPSRFPRDEALAYLMKHAPQDDGFDSDDIERKFAHACAEKGYTGGRENVPDGGAEDDFGPLGPDAGHTDAGGDRSDGKRHLVVQRASEITPRKVMWLWDGHMALGTLSLLAGREGLGKSSLIAWLVAQITLGNLPGNLQGSPRAVIIAATEDSWEHTLVPRLMAAGADLDLVLRVDVMTSKGFTVDLSLPDDIPAVKELAEQERVALMVMDPLMSRLHNLDTHKDAEVRIALEPLVRMADEVHMSLVGLIHLNKSSTDPLNAVMGSKAFTAVARSVSTVVPDDSDEDDRRRLFGTVKNNLGPAMNNSQVYTIETADVDTPDGPTPVGKLVWHGEADTSIKAAMSDPGMDHRSAVQEATVWLFDYLTEARPDAVKRKTVISAAGKEGISESSVKRAASKLQVISEPSGFPRTTYWSLPEDFEPIAEGDE